MFEIGATVYACNYGPGDTWLLGRVTEVQGFTLYTVLLDDGRSVRRHADQLQARVEARDVMNDADDVEYATSGVSDSQGVPDQVFVEHESSRTASETIEQSDPITPTPSSESDGDHRRSCRHRQPPDRYGYSGN